MEGGKWPKVGKVDRFMAQRKYIVCISIYLHPRVRNKMMNASPISMVISNSFLAFHVYYYIPRLYKQPLGEEFGDRGYGTRMLHFFNRTCVK